MCEQEFLNLSIVNIEFDFFEQMREGQFLSI